MMRTYIYSRDNVPNMMFCGSIKFYLLYVYYYKKIDGNL